MEEKIYEIFKNLSNDELTELQVDIMKSRREKVEAKKIISYATKISEEQEMSMKNAVEWAELALYREIAKRFSC